MIGIPLIFLGLIEITLRWTGYGHPTAFLLSATQNGRAVFVQNNQFGWRFFGREMARWPQPFSISQRKATNSIRIFVLGESAARGEPQPEFGLSRLLQTLLAGKHPQTHFEVINTAMTAINSHAILPIARDCAAADGDIWVIYMGNNEVVGPFGAGTVFGSQTPPLPLIRAGLAAKTTRTGQLLDSWMRKIQKSALDESVWGGMALFLDQQVHADDPRMNGVYHHFQRNLDDIIHAGQRNGAGIVVSTVAVNLKDCPPFSSAHRSGLSDADKSKWEQLFQAGIIAQTREGYQEAAQLFREAAKLDDSHAEHRFRQGQCAQALGEAKEARIHFQAARDLDTLRFRCDTKLNDLIRRAATNREPDRIMFADAERAFEEMSADGSPGAEFFYEHVHFTFAGNYLLARTIAGQVEKLLPQRVTTHTDTPWPSITDCAQRLACSQWNEAAALNSIIATLNDPPFTSQLGHEAQMRRLETDLGKLSPAIQPAGIAAAIKLCEEALAASPDDPILHSQSASLKMAAGDVAGAEAAIRRELELLPNDQEGWSLLGSILARQNRIDEAKAAFRQAFELGPQGIKSMLNLAAALAGLGKPDEAIHEYRRVLAMKPRCVPALLQIGQVVEKLGRKTEAEDYFQRALTNRSQRLPELIELGNFFQTRGAHENALAVHLDAIKLNPLDARLQLAAGRNLASLGRYEDAERYSTEAVRLSPQFVEAHLLHGIVLWRRNRTSQAEEQFTEALRLRPESLDARLNLGVLFAQQGRKDEALAQLDGVLKRNPTNALALKHVQSLRGEAQKNPSQGLRQN